MRRALVLLLVTALVGCGTNVPRPSDENLRAQLEVLLNRAGSSEISWNQSVVDQQLSQPLPQGKATNVGWMLEWKAQDGALSYAVLPWKMLGVPDPHVKGELAYGGGVEPSSDVSQQVHDVVVSGLDPSIRYLVDVNSIRVQGKYAAFSVTPLLPVTDDAYGFAEKVGNTWEVRDLGSAEIGCGLLPKQVLEGFKVRCTS